MAIPISDTSVSVWRSYTEDAYDLREPYLVASGVRAVLNAPIAAARMPAAEVGQGLLSRATRTLVCDPVDLQVGDTVVEDSTGLSYEVVLASPAHNIIPHTVAELSEVKYNKR